MYALIDNNVISILMFIFLFPSLERISLGILMWSSWFRIICRKPPKFHNCMSHKNGGWCARMDPILHRVQPEHTLQSEIQRSDATLEGLGRTNKGRSGLGVLGWLLQLGGRHPKQKQLVPQIHDALYGCTSRIKVGAKLCGSHRSRNRILQHIYWFILRFLHY